MRGSKTGLGDSQHKYCCTYVFYKDSLYGLTMKIFLKKYNKKDGHYEILDKEYSFDVNKNSDITLVENGEFKIETQRLFKEIQRTADYKDNPRSKKQKFNSQLYNGRPPLKDQILTFSPTYKDDEGKYALEKFNSMTRHIRYFYRGSENEAPDSKINHINFDYLEKHKSL